ncbi:hypothetical protein ACNI65_08320 [Roseateles sp. So40a]|uniref:hypothetical protein n=1 Tax=Roseateles sp. So40a TaxID=3400226 RepID=UPI003A889092
MTTTTQRRRPAARKTRALDEAAPAAEPVIAEPVIAESVIDTPTPEAKPARKRASRAKAKPEAVIDTEADTAEPIVAEEAPAPKKRPARKRAAVAEVQAEAIAEDQPAPVEAEAAIEEAPRKGRRKPKAEAVDAVVEEAPAEPAVPPEPPRFTLGTREDDGVFGDYELRDAETGGTFQLRLLGRHTWRCSCADYRAHGGCEHGAHLLALFDAAQHEALDAGWPGREAEVWLVPGAERGLQWVCGRDVPARLRDQWGLDEQQRRGAEGAHDWLQTLLSEARALGVTLRVDAPVWPQLACGRDAQARVARIEALMADGDAMRALLRDELPEPAWEAALFAVCAGRALIADDLGLGQRGAAIAAIRLWTHCFGVKPAVVIAPESHHAAWQRDLTRWLGDEAKSVILSATPPAKPLPQPASALLVIDGIESVDAERLAALRALPAAQLLLIAHQEPLGDARLGEWIDWLDELRRGPAARLASLPADAGKKLRREALEAVVLSRRKRELADTLPAALLSPLWLDGAGNNGTSLPATPLKQLRQLIERWTALRFLSTVEQQQLLEALALLAPASRQALAAKAEAVLALRREWIESPAPAAARLVVCARSETLLDSLSMSPQLRRLPPQRLRAGDDAATREAALTAWRAAPAGVLLASDDALVSLENGGQEGALRDDRLAVVHADLPWQAAVLERRVHLLCGEDARGVPAALLLIEASLDAAVLRAQKSGVDFPSWLDAAPAWLDADQLEALMAVLPALIEGL